MKKKILIGIVVAIIIFIILFFARSLNGGEDNWIKDERGVYVKHGNPTVVPEEVRNQLDLIVKAKVLFQQKKLEGIQFNSQCLGSINDYAIDIVHIPRNDEDNNVDNQCSDFREGKVHHFIELDRNGDIVRIV